MDKCEERKTMKRFKGLVLVALAVLTVLVYVPDQPVSAQSAALSINPKKNYLIEPGKSIEDKLSIRNIDSNDNLDLYLRVVDFTYTDETGTPKLLLEEGLEQTTWSLKPYLTIPSTASVGPGDTTSLDISVDIPEGLGAGSYYSAIVYSTTAPEGGNVGLSASGVTLVFVNVPGKVNEDLTITKFGLYDRDKTNGTGYTNFTMDEPLAMAYTIKNNGNVVEAPVGSIEVKGWFGQNYKITDVNTSDLVALIGQTRTFETCIKAEETTDANSNTTGRCVSAGLWPGFYTATADLYYGQNGNLTKELTKTSYFWYLPLWFIVLFVIALVVAAFYIWRTIVWIRGGSFKLGGRPRQRKSRRRR